MSQGLAPASRGPSIEFRGVRGDRPEHASVLTPEAVGFVAELQAEFGRRREELLALRRVRQRDWDAGMLPGFNPDSPSIRDDPWTVAPIPADLRDRRVEITGPVDRKMTINGLNSGARVFMADFEDANSPTWDNCVQGQKNLMDAVRGDITYTSPEGKAYALGGNPATLMVRPRGWHLWERHLEVGGLPVSASLFDFGLHFFHCARARLERGSGPYFYLPKLENHLEARLWNDVFLFAQDRLSLPRGSVRATVLIENILASFEMHEILWELREHSAGLNCGRWDYIFSVIRTFRNRRDLVLPDRRLITMTTPFMRKYSLLCIQTCHRRGTHAMGGMAAQIPVKNDPVANEDALEKVRSDKKREVADGHDGTWVAHPALVPLATDIFDLAMPEPNQIDRLREDVSISGADLLDFQPGEITEDGLRTNVSVGLRYLEPWLRGLGCVPINNLMEDAATAEISRAQVWQWIRSPRGVLNTGANITAELFRSMLAEEADGGARGQPDNRYPQACAIFDRVATGDWVDFLTTEAYDYLD